MTKTPRHEGNAYPSDETIRKMRQDASDRAEKARTLKEAADKYSEKVREHLEKEHLDRITDREDAQRRDPKRK